MGDSDDEEPTQYPPDPELEFFRVAEKVWIDNGKGGVYRLNATRGSARMLRYFGSKEAADKFEEMVFQMRKAR